MKHRKQLETDAPPIGERLLTLRKAADVLRLSTRTIREYVLRGEIEGRIIGGRWRFRRADLDAFFANCTPELGLRWKQWSRGLDGGAAKTGPRMAWPFPRFLGQAQLRDHARPIRAESHICWSGKVNGTAKSKKRCVPTWIVRRNRNDWRTTLIRTTLTPRITMWN